MGVHSHKLADFTDPEVHFIRYGGGRWGCSLHITSMTLKTWGEQALYSYGLHVIISKNRWLPIY